MEEFVDTLKMGYELVVFPEGTTTNGLHGLVQFKSTPFEAAIKAGLPIKPVLIRYIDDDPDSICWYGDMTFPDHAWRFLGKKKIKAELHVMDIIPVNTSDRKALSRTAWELMDREYRSLPTKQDTTDNRTHTNIPLSQEKRAS